MKNKKSVHREHEKSKNDELSFWDIDEPLQKNFRLRITEGVVFAMCGVIMGMMLKSLALSLTTMIAALFICGIVWYQVLRCLEGDIYKFEGICVETYKDDEDRKFYSRKYILLQTKEGLYIKIYNDRAAKIVKENNIVAFYALPDTFRQVNEDSFQIDNYYYLYVKKTNGYDEYNIIADREEDNN